MLQEGKKIDLQETLTDVAEYSQHADFGILLFELCNHSFLQKVLFIFI